MYVSRARPRRQSVHGRGRPCTRAVNTAVHRAHDRVGVPCTRPWSHYVHGRCTRVYTVRTRSVHAVNGRVHGHIHGTYTAVHTGRKHGRLHGRKHGRVHGHGWTMYMARARPWAAVYRLCTAALGRVQTVYTAVHGPCTWSVCVPNTAVYAAGTWQNTARYAARTRPRKYRIHGRARAVYRVHGRLYGPCARPCTYHVHGRAWSVHDPNTVLYTAVFTARVHGPCTRPCIVYMHVFVACVYGRPRPCTDCVRAMYMVRS